MKKNTFIHIRSVFIVLSNFKQKFIKSFTLIELSVALAVISILSGVGITAYKASNPELRQDLKKIQAIQEKLQEFFNTNGRLPFPARASDVKGSNHYLVEYKIGANQKYGQGNYKCNDESDLTKENNHSYYSNDNDMTLSSGSCPSNDILWGVVPTRTLGLPDDYAYDSQGHNFEYITDISIAFYNGTQFRSDEGYVKSNYTTSNDGKYKVYYNTENKQYKPFTMNLFNLSIFNNKENSVIQNTSQNTAYIIISKGKTNKCYWNNRSTILNSNQDIPTDNTKYNCQANYENGSFNSLNIYQGYSKDFDNIVKYQTLSELVIKSYKADEKGQGLGSNNADSTDSYYNALPKGTMVLFYLNANNIPKGWQICDGTNGTPDMKGNFAMGASDDESVDTDDGSNVKTLTITTENIPSHNHDITSDGGSVSTSCNGAYSPSCSCSTKDSGSHKHWISDGYYHKVKADADRDREVIVANNTNNGVSNDDLVKKTQNTGNSGSHSHDCSCSVSSIKCHTHTINLTNFSIGNRGSGKPIALDVTNKHKKVYYICKVK